MLTWLTLNLYFTNDINFCFHSDILRVWNLEKFDFCYKLGGLWLNTKVSQVTRLIGENVGTIKGVSFGEIIMKCDLLYNIIFIFDLIFISDRRMETTGILSISIILVLIITIQNIIMALSFLNTNRQAIIFWIDTLVIRPFNYTGKYYMISAYSAYFFSLMTIGIPILLNDRQ